MSAFLIPSELYTLKHQLETIKRPRLSHMESSTVPPGITGAPPATEPDVSLTSRLDSSIASLPSTGAPLGSTGAPPAAEPDVSLISRLDSSIASLPSTQAPPGSTGAPPAAEPDVSLTSRLDSSIAFLPSTQAPAVLSNAVPPSHGTTSHHPPYAEMIITAIRALGDRKGSSKKAINKYIDATYSNLPVSHAALLSHHLKRLKNSGVVIMVKHSYKLPKNVKAAFQLSPQTKSAAAPSSLAMPGKRGRGRPPKPKPLDAGGPALPKRGPRRSPKAKTKPVIFTVGPDGQFLQQKRGRGRPPKPKPMLVPGTNGFLAPPKPRRQPKKPRPITITPSYGLAAPKQTRKPPKPRAFVASAHKGSLTGALRPRGRPRKDAALSSSSSSVVGVNRGSRPRGRPPKVPKSDAGAAAVVVLPLAGLVLAPVGDASGGGATAVGGVNGGPSNVVAPEKRGRGRPRKANGPPTLKRPVGRPKKVIVTVTPSLATAMPAVG